MLAAALTAAAEPGHIRGYCVGSADSVRGSSWRSMGQQGGSARQSTGQAGTEVLQAPMVAVFVYWQL